MAHSFGLSPSSPRRWGTGGFTDRCTGYGRFIPAWRGAGLHPCQVPTCPRFIPACAGNSSRNARVARQPPVHPRVCGEQILSSRSNFQWRGSSPRVRGTEPDTQRSQDLERFIPACAGTGWAEDRYGLRSRFIPACAGNSTKAAKPSAISAVHPRVCGERFVKALANCQPTGSSPRVRRTGMCICLTGQPNAVHPRVCGEQDQHMIVAPSPIGSSPRVRGTVIVAMLAAGVFRFIPACAGNSEFQQLQSIEFGSSPRCVSVHPRVCGEQCRFRNPLLDQSGSSPRVRGTVIGNGAGSPFDRFIPACAGNSRLTRSPDIAAAVHPRVCGEQCPEGAGAGQGNGSSPRVRGTDVV